MKSTGTTDYPSPIKVRLLGYQKHIVVEVWDRATDELVLPKPRSNKDEPHGLPLIDATATSWGARPVPKGRVMWAELPAHEQTKDGLPIRTPQPTSHPRPSTAVIDRPSDYGDFLRRVRDGLERL